MAKRPPPPPTIFDLKRAAADIGISLRGLQRLIAQGEGPVVTQLTPGRIGISDADLTVWLRSRRRLAQPVQGEQTAA